MKTKPLLTKLMTLLIVLNIIIPFGISAQDTESLQTQLNYFESNDPAEMMEVIAGRAAELCDGECPDNFTKNEAKARNIENNDDFIDQYNSFNEQLQGDSNSIIKTEALKYGISFNAYGEDNQLKAWSDLNYRMGRPTLDEDENSEDEVEEEITEEPILPPIYIPPVVTIEDEEDDESEDTTDDIIAEEDSSESDDSSSSSSEDSSEDPDDSSSSSSEDSSEDPDDAEKLSNYRIIVTEIQQKGEDLTKEAQKLQEDVFIDTDNDGFSDIFEEAAGTDPLDPNSNEEALISGGAITPKILNWKDGELTTDTTPLLKGMAVAYSTATVTLTNTETKDSVKYQRIADKNNRFIIEVDELPYGQYKIDVDMMYQNGNLTISGKPIGISIFDSIEGVLANQLTPPTTTINQEDKVLLSGYSAKPFSIIRMEWQSLIFASAVISDSNGYYEMSPPDQFYKEEDLVGDHVAWAYSIDPETGIKSDNTSMDFSVTEASQVNLLQLDNNNILSTKNIGSAAGLLLLALLTGVIIKRKKSKKIQ